MLATLVNADDHVHAMLPGGLRNLPDFGAGNLDGGKTQLFEPGAALNWRHDPVPVRIPGNEHFRESNQLSRSEEHTSELQSLMRISYAVFCLKKKKRKTQTNT